MVASAELSTIASSATMKDASEATASTQFFPLAEWLSSILPSPSDRCRALRWLRDQDEREGEKRSRQKILCSAESFSGCRTSRQDHGMIEWRDP